MTNKEYKRCVSIWKNDEQLRAEWKGDFDKYIEAMQMHYEMCAAMGQVS